VIFDGVAMMVRMDVLTEEALAMARLVGECAPPLNDEQRDKLRVLLSAS
jgi:hypothetical protein